MRNRILKIGAGLAGIVLTGVVAIESLAPRIIARKLNSPEYLAQAKPWVESRVASYLPSALDETLDETVDEKVARCKIFFEAGGVDPQKVSASIKNYLRDNDFFYVHLKKFAEEDVREFVEKGFNENDYSLGIKKVPGFFSRHNPTKYVYELDFKEDDLANFGITKKEGEYKPVDVLEEDCPELYNEIRNIIREKSMSRALKETGIDVAKIVGSYVNDLRRTLTEKAKGLEGKIFDANTLKEKFQKGVQNLKEKVHIPEGAKPYLEDVKRATQEAKVGAKKFWDNVLDYFK